MQCPICKSNKPLGIAMTLKWAILLCCACGYRRVKKIYFTPAVVALLILSLWSPAWADSLVGSVEWAGSYNLTAGLSSWQGTNANLTPLLAGALIPTTGVVLNLQTTALFPQGSLLFLAQPIYTVTIGGPTVVGTDASGTFAGQAVTGRGWASAWFTPIGVGTLTLTGLRFDLTDQRLNSFFQPIGGTVPEPATGILLGIGVLALIGWREHARRVYYVS